MRIPLLGLALLSITTITGACTTDSSDEDTQSSELAAAPNLSAFVLTVSSDENPVNVTSSSGTNNCPGSPSCNFAYLEGTALTIATRPQNTIDCIAFTRWTGACAGQPATCHLTINSNLSTNAEFSTRILGCIPK